VLTRLPAIFSFISLRLHNNGDIEGVSLFKCFAGPPAVQRDSATRTYETGNSDNPCEMPAPNCHPKLSQQLQQHSDISERTYYQHALERAIGTQLGFPTHTSAGIRGSGVIRPGLNLKLKTLTYGFNTFLRRYYNLV